MSVLFRLLMEREDDHKIFCRFFCAGSLEGLEYVPNPITVFHTPYSQENFKEVCDFRRYNAIMEYRKQEHLQPVCRNAFPFCMSM